MDGATTTSNGAHATRPMSLPHAASALSRITRRSGDAGEAKVLIIGGGPTGLGAAWRLHELGYQSWELIDAGDRAGGLASSVIDDKGFTWDLGGHVIFSHYEYFDRLLDDLLGDAWEEHIRESWVWMRERFIPYPFQHNVWRLPQAELIACLEGMLAVHGQPASSGPQPANFREWILRSFGQGIADAFMLPYNFKVWAYDPSELTVGWMGERVATIDLPRTLRNLVAQKDDVSWGPNARFRFPRHGGTGAVWRALQARLPKEKLSFGRRVVAVDGDARTVQLDDGSICRYDALVSTMPLDCLLGAMGARPDLARHAPSFKHSSSHIIGIGLDGRLPDELRTKCWMYFPEDKVPPYRITVFSNYSPYNVPLPGKQWSLMCEVSESPRKPVDGDRIAQRTLDDLRAIGFIPADAPLLSLWHRRLEYGYPTPFVGRDEILSAVDPELRRMGIFSRGRFGAWKYEVSNQDHSLMLGVEAVDHLLFGTEETTYHHPNAVNASKGIGRRPVLTACAAE
jgi:protoporphyrinogen oxidase